MLELEQAVEKILAAIPAPKSEMVALADACGRIVAEQILAATDLPPFDNSSMDGYAVRAQDVASASAQKPVTLRLAGRVAAGEHFTGQLSVGQCIRIFTGSPLPVGADAVVMQEDTRVSAQNEKVADLPNAGTTSPSPPRSGGLEPLGKRRKEAAKQRPDRAERAGASESLGRGEVAVRAQGEILILDTVKPWENIRFRGEDVKRGAVIAEPGTRLGAAHIGLLAATGVGQVSVNRRPTVALLATGSELQEPITGAQLAPGQIFESNRAALTALISATGAIPKIFPIVPDTAEATRAALTRAFAESDIVITCGGVSVGEMDFVKSAFEELGGKLDFWKVAIKPGRPFVFGRLSAAKGENPLDVGCSMLDVGCSSVQEKFLFGLPGNPISAFVTFLLLARPALLRWQGATNVSLPTSLGTLSEPFSNPDNRRHFVRVTVDATGGIHSAGTQASHILSSLAVANGLIDLPPKTTLAAETTVQILRWE